MLALADAARSGGPISIKEHIVRAFIGAPSMYMDPSILPLSLTVDPRWRTRFYGQSHVRLVCYELAKLLVANGVLSDRSIEVCHAELADETDRELLDALDRRVHRSSTGLRIARRRSDGGEARLYPDVQAAEMVEMPGFAGAMEGRSWHDARPQSSLMDRTIVLRWCFIFCGVARLRAARSHLRRLLIDAAGLGHYEAALRYGRQFLASGASGDESDSDYHAALNAYGMAFLQTEQPYAALSVFDAALKERSEPALHVTGHYVRAMVYTRYAPPEERSLTKVSAALDQAEAAAVEIEDPRLRCHCEAFLLNARALVSMHRGDLAGGIALLDRDLELLRTQFGTLDELQHDVVVHDNRSTLHMKVGQVDRAIEDLSYVIEKDSHTAEYRVDRAIALHAAGRVSESLDDLNVAIEHCITGPEAYQNRALLRREEGDLDGAIDDLRIACDMEPADEEALALLSEVLIDSGMLDDAERVLGQSDADLASDERFIVFRARIAASRDDISEALRILDRGLDQHSDSVPLRMERSAVLHMAHRLDDALDDIEHVAASGESSPILDLNRVMLLVELGRIDEACQRLTPLLGEGLPPELRDHAQGLQSAIGGAHSSVPT
ncbi:tetratricopeptide repeat protein [Actinomadura madurae]|uniref:tetratricopeptide repeat protein n=1 Tax=Actinomadura madurae TaxID=1993 RepID=UPI00202673AC|nr:tetratricopeptide repeat protein [Actinomadura madurae]URN08527.1 tetratricopeptide repeat protein [Actinomadura madurae]